MRLLDDQANERSNLRYSLGPWMAACMLRWAGEADSSVLVGTDRWLFLERRMVTPDLSVEEPARIWANVLRAVERRLLARRTRLLVFPVPRRAVAVADLLPEGYDPQPERDIAFLEALSERGVPHVNLIDGLGGQRARDLWSRYDSHWSRRGQLVAAGMIATALRQKSGISPEGREERLAVLDLTTLKKQKAGLLEYAGIRLGSMARRVVIPLEWTPQLMPPERHQARQLLKPGRQDAGVWVTGTSYVAGENLLAYLRLELGTSVFSAAERGQYTSEALAKHLEQRERPTDLLVDMPCDQVFQRMTQRGGTVAIARVSTMALSTGLLSPSRRVHHTLEVEGRNIALQERSILASADGALAVRAIGAAKVERSFQMSVGALKYWLPWNADAASCILPLVSCSHQIDGASLQFVSPHVGDLDGVQLSLVTPFRAEEESLRTYPVSGTEDAWSVRIPLTESEPIQALWIPGLKATGQVEVVKILRSTSEGASPSEKILVAGKVFGRTLVMVDLGNLDGVIEVHIRGSQLRSDRIQAAIIPALR